MLVVDLCCYPLCLLALISILTIFCMYFKMLALECHVSLSRAYYNSTLSKEKTFCAYFHKPSCRCLWHGIWQPFQWKCICEQCNGAHTRMHTSWHMRHSIANMNCTNQITHGTWRILISILCAWHICAGIVHLWKSIVYRKCWLWPNNGSDLVQIVCMSNHWCDRKFTVQLNWGQSWMAGVNRFWVKLNSTKSPNVNPAQAYYTHISFIWNKYFSNISVFCYFLTHTHSLSLSVSLTLSPSVSLCLSPDDSIGAQCCRIFAP